MLYPGSRFRMAEELLETYVRQLIEAHSHVPGVLVVRMDGPLFFADATRFRQSLSQLVRETPGPIKAVVLDADSVQLTDTDGADILIQVQGELEAQGTSLLLARAHPKVLGLWRRGGLLEKNGSGHAYATVREAVGAVAS